MHALQRGQGAVVGLLGHNPKTQVGSEAGLLLLCERFGDSAFAGLVVDGYVLPELAVDAADAAQFPAGLGEFFN